MFQIRGSDFSRGLFHTHEALNTVLERIEHISVLKIDVMHSYFPIMITEGHLTLQFPDL